LGDIEESSKSQV